MWYKFGLEVIPEYVSAASLSRTEVQAFDFDLFDFDLSLDVVLDTVDCRICGRDPEVVLAEAETRARISEAVVNAVVAEDGVETFDISLGLEETGQIESRTLLETPGLEIGSSISATTASEDLI